VTGRPGASVLLSILAIALGASFCVGSSAAATQHEAPYVRLGTPLNDTALGSGTVLGGIAMYSDSSGYAVAARVWRGRGWFYLARTTNLGNSWTVRAPLPVASFVGIYGWGDAPALDFLTSKIGYLQVYQGPVWVTDDGGNKWSKVLTPGIDPTYVTSAHAIFVTSDLCKEPTTANATTCASDLSTYREGAVSPYRTVRIPALGAGPWHAAEVLGDLAPTTQVVVEGRGELQSSLLATFNAGRSWHQLANPCAGLVVQQVLATSPSRWLLGCYGDAAMNQGTNELWGSENAGVSWSLVAEGSEQGVEKGGLFDVPSTYYLGGQGILLAALGGAAGGVQYSTDHGLQWHLANLRLDMFGGSPETISTFGATGAILSVQNQAAFRTRNAKTWTALPSLPAGPFRGLSICSPKNVKVSLGTEETGLPASVRDYPLVFTNDSNRACYLNGVPNVQTLRDNQKLPVGPSASAYESGRGGFVVVRALGGKASVAFGIQAAHSYSRKFCRPRTVSGLRISFDERSSFYLTTPGWLVCATPDMTSVEGVTRGVANWQ
jgi:photosystem II stability/assembly factor-like uncharacterized protein